MEFSAKCLFSQRSTNNSGQKGGEEPDRIHVNQDLIRLAQRLTGKTQRGADRSQIQVMNKSRELPILTKALVPASTSSLSCKRVSDDNFAYELWRKE